jgi:hypothetical protein
MLFNFQDYRRWLDGQHFIDLDDGRQVSEIGYIARYFGRTRHVCRLKRLK